MHTAEEQHWSGVVDSIKHSALFVHPERDNISLVGELLWQRLCPEATLGDQVWAGVLRQGVWVDPRWVFGRETKTQSTTPAALLFSDLQSTYF